MPPRLKVFVTSDGLTDFVVAASSRPKALAAWGSHQDLFRIGLAHETDDPELVKVASARPGEVLRRPAGTRGVLARLKPTRKPPAKPARKAAARPAGPTKAALKKIADLEKKLTAADQAYGAARRKLEHQRGALDRKVEALEAQHAAERARLEAALNAARQAPGSPPPDSGLNRASGRASR